MGNKTTELKQEKISSGDFKENQHLKKSPINTCYTNDNEQVLWDVDSTVMDSDEFHDYRYYNLCYSELTLCSRNTKV